MTRDLGDLATEITQPVLRPFWALHLALPDVVRCWTGVGTLTFLGQQWDGIGSFGGISGLSEGSDGTANKISFSLSGVDQTFYQYLVEQPYRGARIELYCGALDEAYQQVVAVKTDPIYAGSLTEVTLTDGEAIQIDISCERASRDQMRQRVRRYTNEEQQRLHPGDMFFEYQAQMQSVQVIWGKKG